LPEGPREGNGCERIGCPLVLLNFGKAALFVVLDRRDLFAIGTLEGRSSGSPPSLGVILTSFLP